jgi:hypothetical protein
MPKRNQYASRDKLLLLGGAVLGAVFVIIGSVAANFLWEASNRNITLGNFAHIITLALVLISLMVIIKSAFWKRPK